VSGSEHDTLGFLADGTEGDWNDIVIEHSSFNQNRDDGMQLIGAAQNPGEFPVTVVGFRFNVN
jgi:hypothetical protein